MSEVIEHNPAPPQASTPAQLIEVAISTGADVDKLQQLMEMQLRWEENEARKAFVKAMSEFRANAPTISKNKNGHNSRYASIDHITETINPLLSEHGLSYGWSTEQGDTITVHCDVTHIEGHAKRVSLSATADKSGSKNDIQAIGSTVSYLQRYTLLSALGLATGEHDNDGGSPVGRALNQTEQTYSGPAAELLQEAQDLDDLKAAWARLTSKERNELNSLFGQRKRELR